jgi:DNA-binding IclR family transcriptional regulator
MAGVHATESNKARIAKRVIEVLEYFDDLHPQATVMDIVRRYDRPQSSTSELLSSMVDLGLLYKDPCSRSYTLTARAAMLGAATQPENVRDGRLVTLIDRLSAQTGLAVAVFGLIGLNTQIFTWRSGTKTLRTANPRGLGGGLQERLTDSAAGHLLASTVPLPRRDGVLRRLNAEAPDDRKFVFGEMSATVLKARDDGFAHGPVGFGSIADVCAVLLPGQPMNHPIAIGLVYEPGETIDPMALVKCLREGIAHCLDRPSTESAEIVSRFASAA